MEPEFEIGVIVVAGDGATVEDGENTVVLVVEVVVVVVVPACAETIPFACSYPDRFVITIIETESPTATPVTVIRAPFRLTEPCET